MIALGVGSRKGATGSEVIAAIDAALTAHRLSRADVDRLATARFKENEAGVREAAETLGLELTIVDEDAIAGTSQRLLTRSDLSAATAGTPSVSEAAALAVLGASAKLLGPRVAVGPATCAIATSGSAP